MDILIKLIVCSFFCSNIHAQHYGAQISYYPKYHSQYVKPVIHRQQVSTQTTPTAGSTRLAAGASGSPLIRLVGDRGPLEGRVQVYHGSEWRNVCDDKFDVSEATVACRELGYLGTRTPQPIVATANTWFTDNGTDFWLDDLACRGTESSLGLCPNPGWGVENCGESESAGVKCFHLPVQLSNDGFVQVLQNHQWTSVCPVDFDWNVGKVVCRSLGFQDSHVLVDVSIPDAVSADPEFLFDFKCTGSETDLEQCVGYQRTAACPTASRKKMKCLNGSLEDIVSMKCDNNSFNVEVDVVSLRTLYPDFIPSDLRLGGHCSGSIDGNNKLILNERFNTCLTRTKELSSEMFSFTNELVYVTKTSGDVIKNFHWAIDLECRVSRNEFIEISYRPIESNHEHHLNSSSHLKSEIHLFADPLYTNKAESSSITVGSSVYVQVKSPDVAGLRMILTDCYAKPSANADRSSWHVLIANGCEKDPDAHLTRYANSETRFFFTAFAFPSGQTVVDVHCDVRFCSNLKRSTSCHHGCQASAGIIG